MMYLISSIPWQASIRKLSSRIEPRRSTSSEPTIIISQPNHVCAHNYYQWCHVAEDSHKPLRWFSHNSQKGIVELCNMLYKTSTMLSLSVDALSPTFTATKSMMHRWRWEDMSVDIDLQGMWSSTLQGSQFFLHKDDIQNQNQNQNRFIRSYYRPRRPPLRSIWSLSQRPPGKKIYTWMYVKLVNTSKS